MMMRTYLPGILVLLASQAALAEPCVHVVDRALERPPADVTLAPVIWTVTLENRCEGSYQVDLTLRFLDGDGAQLYEVRHLENVSRRERVEIEKEAYMPGRYVDAVVSFGVDIEERERPF